MHADAVGQQLERILATDRFRRAPRLSQFLRYVVESTVEGRAGELKETTVGIAVFERQPGFDPKIEPVVRVQARRLREKLTEYYSEDGLRDRLVIAMPKGGYAPLIEWRSPEVEAPATPPPASAGHLRKYGLWLAIPFLAILLWRLQTSTGHGIALAGPRKMLTTLPGIESRPAWSADGKRLAFEWRKKGAANASIFLIDVPGAAPKKLTASAAGEAVPVWSPNGSQVAFYRRVDALRSEVIVHDLGDGAEKSYGEVHRIFDDSTEHPGMDWSPDGKWLAVCEQKDAVVPSRAMLIDLTNGNRLPLTSPTVGSSGDLDLRFSPNGKRLAFRRGFLGELHFGDLGEGMTLVERRIPHSISGVRGMDWIDDNTIVYGAFGKNGAFAIWTVSLPDGKSKQISASESAVAWPVMNRSTLSLSVVEQRRDVDLLEIELRTLEVSRTLFRSAGFEGGAVYSPDGGRMAFVSTRGGSQDIWIGNLENGESKQLTHFQGASFAPQVRWRPDGKTLVAHLRRDGNSDLYEIQIPGGEERRLTAEHSRELFPAYSGDGKHIYFTSDRTGSMQIYRMPAGAQRGSAELAVEDGGLRAEPLADGGLAVELARGGTAYWLYPPRGERKTLLAASSLGDAYQAWGIDASRIYLIERGRDLRTVNRLTGETSTAILPVNVPGFQERCFHLHPGGKKAVICHLAQEESDLVSLGPLQP